ncbi:MAG: N-(5'-phosphoribosyl)anthranilate isomerase [Nitratiruptor sp.]|nr:N-(5'-phosphoribosyl)anthranilate isomerase [Nitratiruptor sp.]NPA83084.1 phosphoribosylanthranilate isomerase [Campylobacterota bacterium]
MVRVKICGITNVEDAFLAVEAGADALGFVFYPKSPRYITPQQAAKITRQLPPFVERVGLFVEESPEQIERIAQESGMGLVQLHWDVDQEFLEALQIKALPVVRVREEADLERFADRYRLVDAYVPGYGGAGKRIPLEWFAGRDCSKMILAGGLDSENVSQVVGYGFYGVDVSSGVEREQGRKDPWKVRSFIQRAKFASL